MTIINLNAPWQIPNQWNIPVQPAPVHIHHHHIVEKKASRANSFSPVKAGESTAHVVFILDDSGSMQSCRDQTIAGFNEFLAGQQESEIPTFVSLYKFDGSNTKCVYSHVPVSIAPKLNRETYNPQGGTNLLDSIGDVMFQVNTELAAVGKSKNRDSVTIVILTDGEENSSREFNNVEIAGMVAKAEKKNWSFFFLGANIDAFAVGSTFGFGTSNTIQYSTKNMGETMAAASRATNDMKMSRSLGLNTVQAYAASAFTEEERKDVL